MVDGLGISGVEGPFRKCCEDTMRLLRRPNNLVALLTLAEVTHTHTRARARAHSNTRRRTCTRAPIHTHSNGPQPHAHPYSLTDTHTITHTHVHAYTQVFIHDPLYCWIMPIDKKLDLQRQPIDDANGRDAGTGVLADGTQVRSTRAFLRIRVRVFAHVLTLT